MRRTCVKGGLAVLTAIFAYGVAHAEDLATKAPEPMSSQPPITQDAKTGAEIHKTNVNGGIGGGVITFRAGDRQLIAVAAGDNNFTYGTKGKNTIVEK